MFPFNAGLGMKRSHSASGDLSRRHSHLADNVQQNHALESADVNVVASTLHNAQANCEIKPEDAALVAKALKQLISPDSFDSIEPAISLFALPAVSDASSSAPVSSSLLLFSRASDSSALIMPVMTLLQAQNQAELMEAKQVAIRAAYVVTLYFQFVCQAMSKVKTATTIAESSHIALPILKSYIHEAYEAMANIERSVKAYRSMLDSLYRVAQSFPELAEEVQQNRQRIEWCIYKAPQCRSALDDLHSAVLREDRPEKSHVLSVSLPSLDLDPVRHSLSVPPVTGFRP